jgi:hypothetical protein
LAPLQRREALPMVEMAHLASAQELIKRWVGQVGKNR